MHVLLCRTFGLECSSWHFGRHCTFSACFSTSAETFLLLTVLAHRACSKFFTANTLFKLLTYLLNYIMSGPVVQFLHFSNICYAGPSAWNTFSDILKTIYFLCPLLGTNLTFLLVILLAHRVHSRLFTVNALRKLLTCLLSHLFLFWCVFWSGLAWHCVRLFGCYKIMHRGARLYLAPRVPDQGTWVGLERYWHWVIGYYWAIFADIG